MGWSWLLEGLLDEEVGALFEVASEEVWLVVVMSAVSVFLVRSGGVYASRDMVDVASRD